MFTALEELYALVCAVMIIIIMVAYHAALWAANKYEVIRKRITGGNDSMIDVARELGKNLASCYVELFMNSVANDKSPALLTLDQIPQTLMYEEKEGIFRTSYHIGQRKLALSEIIFICDNISPEDAPMIIYAGAAPSNHLPILLLMFPKIRWILVDPNPFNLRHYKPTYIHTKAASRDNPITQLRAHELLGLVKSSADPVSIINDLFTMEIARAAHEIFPGAYFISDIRTNTDDRGIPDSIDILWNLSQQYNWITTMKPKMSLLKFRHPFYIGADDKFYELAVQEPYKTDFALSKSYGLDFMENYRNGKKLQYFAGTIYLQMWPGPSSTETRLSTNGLELTVYDRHEYDDKLFYYNNINRCFTLHDNPNADRRLGFDLCNDCAAENAVWSRYIDKWHRHVKVKSVKEYVKLMSDYSSGRILKYQSHGTLFSKDDIIALLPAIKAHNAQKKKY
jgi:cap2 methyltransferase